MNILFDSLSLLPFMRFAFTDYQQQKIINQEIIIALILLLFIKLIHNSTKLITMQLIFSSLIYLIILSSVILFESLTNRYLLGGGDLKLIGLTFFAYDFKLTLSAICLGCILATINSLRNQQRKNSIPLAPYLLLGIIIALLFKYFCPILQDLSL